MLPLAELGRTLAFSFAAGINLYATVAILGLASRYGWVALPPQYQVFDNNWIIGIAIALYVVEFFADKVPWIDSIWDAVHTVVRPIGGAFIAVTTLGHASPFTETIVGLLGGTLAAGSHFGKASTRLVANASPEPFSNWILSAVEDAFVVVLGFLALKHPIAAGVVVLIGVVILIAFAGWIYRVLRRRLRGRDLRGDGGHGGEQNTEARRHGAM